MRHTISAPSVDDHPFMPSSHIGCAWEHKQPPRDISAEAARCARCRRAVPRRGSASLARGYTDHALASRVQRCQVPTRCNVRGLRRLKDAAGRRLAGGVVLHDGTTSVRFGEGLFAVPIRALRNHRDRDRRPALPARSPRRSPAVVHAARPCIGPRRPLAMVPARDARPVGVGRGGGYATPGFAGGSHPARGAGGPLARGPGRRARPGAAPGAGRDAAGGGRQIGRASCRERV